MSAFRNALAINACAPAALAATASRVVANGTGTVLFEGIVALRLGAGEIVCAVIDLERSVHRCATEYEVLVENARRALEASTLNALLPRLPRRWLVVEDCGSGTVERWHAR
jgi:hypothetical protein